MTPGPPIDPDFYDEELRRHNLHLRAAANIEAHDIVLDVGCGAGLTTREAAQAATHGRAMGIDLSAQLTECARRRAQAERVTNVAFEHGDAGTHSFQVDQFDVCISRFGVMFFDDPPAAFGNISRAVRPGGRLVLMVWQSRDRNEWFTAVRRALAGPGGGPTPTATDLTPFSLSDRAESERLLAGAGFTDVVFTPVHEPVFYGHDPATAYDAVRSLQHVKTLVDDLDKGQTGPALGRLRAAIEARHTTAGVLFWESSWIIEAQR